MKSREKLWASQWGCWAPHKEELSKIDPLPSEGPRCGQLRGGGWGNRMKMPKSIFPAKLIRGDTCTQTRIWWGCDKHEFCTGLQLGLGADWTDHIPVSSVNSQWAIAADCCEWNISPAELSVLCSTAGIPSLKRGGGTAQPCESLSLSAPVSLLSCHLIMAVTTPWVWVSQYCEVQESLKAYL